MSPDAASPDRNRGAGTTMSAPPITTLEEATPEWLTDALTDTLPVGTRVTHVDAERIGEKVGIASALYRMKLTYSSKATGPTTLILKLNLQEGAIHCLLYTSPSPRDRTRSRMPSSA